MKKKPEAPPHDSRMKKSVYREYYEAIMPYSRIAEQQLMGLRPES